MTAGGGTLQQNPDSGALALRDGLTKWKYALTGIAVGVGAGALGVLG